MRWGCFLWAGWLRGSGDKQGVRPLSLPAPKRAQIRVPETIGMDRERRRRPQGTWDSSMRERTAQNLRTRKNFLLSQEYPSPDLIAHWSALGVLGGSPLSPLALAHFALLAADGGFRNSKARILKAQ